MDNQQKFVNYYMEALTNGFNSINLEKLQLQTNARIMDEVIGTQNKTIQELNDVVTMQSNRIGEMNNDLVRLLSEKDDFENSRHQLSHLETFKNELIASRDEANHLRGQVSIITSERDHLRNQTADLNSRLEAMAAQVSKLNVDLDYFQNSVTQLNMENAKLREPESKKKKVAPKLLAETNADDF